MVTRRRDGRFQALPRAGLLMLAAAGGGPTLLGQTTPSPIALSREPTIVPMPLSANVAHAGGLSDYAQSLSPDERLLLVIEGLHTDRPPGGVFQVYLRPAGATTEKGIYVGSISFFGSRPVGTGGAKRSISLDLTTPLESPEAETRLGKSAEIVILPQGNIGSEAHPSVERIALFVQHS